MKNRGDLYIRDVSTLYLRRDLEPRAADPAGSPPPRRRVRLEQLAQQRERAIAFVVVHRAREECCCAARGGSRGERRADGRGETDGGRCRRIECGVLRRCRDR